MLEPPATLAGKMVFNTMLSADCLMTKMKMGFYYGKIDMRLLFYTVTKVVADVGWLIKNRECLSWLAVLVGRRNIPKPN